MYLSKNTQANEDAEDVVGALEEPGEEIFLVGFKEKEMYF